MKVSKHNVWTLALILIGPLCSSGNTQRVLTSPKIEKVDLRHETSQDVWEWRLPEDMTILVRICQDPGVRRQKAYAIFDFQTTSVAKAKVEFGSTPQLGRVVAELGTPRKKHEIRLDGLSPRGTRYYVRFRLVGAHSSWTSPLLTFKTLLRYPYGYVFSPNDPELRWQPGVPRIITGLIAPDAHEVDQRLREVDAKCYLQHIILTITQPKMSQLQKVKAIMTFVGDAIDHNPIYMYWGPDMLALRQDPKTGRLMPGAFRAVAKILELHYCQCGQVQPVAAALCQLIGVRAGWWEAPNGRHVSGRIMIDGRWYFADEDAYKKGNFPLMPDGSLPPLDWLLSGENVYLLDTKPAWSNWGSKGGWMLTKRGFLITGAIAGGHDQSEDSYPSAWFGARVEFPPSIPKPLPVTHFGTGWVLLEWVGSYDRDNDFRNYRVEVGTRPGLSDVGRFETQRAFYKVVLPHKGTYYWRVTATDHHASRTPYAGRIYYEPSKENSFDTAHLPQVADGPPRLKPISPSDDVLFSLDLKDGSIGGFEPHGNTYDPIGLGEGSYGGTDLFRIEWGKAGYVLELVDPTNRWGSHQVARRTWDEAIKAKIYPRESWEVRCTVRTGRSYMAGNTTFPLLFVTDSADSKYAMGITLNPESGTVGDGVKDSVSWINLDSFDPQNRWHTYTIRFTRVEKAATPKSGDKPQHNFISFFVDGKQVGTDTAIPQVITPGAIWISSNPVAEVTAWIARLEIDRISQ